MISLLALQPLSFTVGGIPPALHTSSAASSTASVRACNPQMQSLAEEMFGDVFKGIKSGVDAVSKAIGSEEETAAAPPPITGDAVATDLDERAKTGDITFDDFMTMASAFAQLGDSSVQGVMPSQLTPAELAETREKFAKHEAIVEVMLPEERASPDLLVDAVKEGGATPGPRLQRLAQASGQPETEVALFVMQFEAMRESTRRIAAGEDPDEVNESMMNPNANRQARRNAAKAAKKSAKKKSKNKM